jgi:hypothetical protein
MILTGGALVMQSKPTTSINPTPIPQADQQMSMETFNQDEANHQVTTQNYKDVMTANQAELQYGLDQGSVNNSVLDIFSQALP